MYLPIYVLLTFTDCCTDQVGTFSPRKSQPAYSLSEIRAAMHEGLTDLKWVSLPLNAWGLVGLSMSWSTKHLTDHRNYPTTETSLSLVNNSTETWERYKDRHVSLFLLSHSNYDVAAVIRYHRPYMKLWVYCRCICEINSLNILHNTKETYIYGLYGSQVNHMK